MANERIKMSAAGISALRKREGAIFHYYNDAANNCTYGVGALAHYGPCVSEELKRSVTVAEVDEQLTAKVWDAAQAVRRQVRRNELSQEQFDALVSFTFNVGASGARSTLSAADSGADKEVAALIMKHVYVHPRDSDGRKLPPIRLQGLVYRRKEEAAPFQHGAMSK